MDDMVTSSCKHSIQCLKHQSNDGFRYHCFTTRGYDLNLGDLQSPTIHAIRVLKSLGIEPTKLLSSFGHDIPWFRTPGFPGQNDCLMCIWYFRHPNTAQMSQKSPLGLPNCLALTAQLESVGQCFCMNFSSISWFFFYARKEGKMCLYTSIYLGALGGSRILMATSREFLSQ